MRRTALIVSFSIVGLIGIAIIGSYHMKVKGYEMPLNAQRLLDRRTEDASIPLRISDVTLERKGTPLSPAYKIIFRKDRTAWYLGIRNVAKIGKYYGEASDFDRLAAWVEMQHFTDFQAEYNKDVYEGEIATTSIVIDGVRKTVTNHAAGGGPIELWVINSAIDGMAANIRWEKRP